MAILGNSITITYTAWNTSTNGPETGDAANHTIKLVKDGTEATATNVPSEVDSTSAKGEYKLTLTAAEMTCDAITICGVSSTANVVIVPVKITTEHGVLPNVQQGSAGAVLTAGTGMAQLNVSAGKVAEVTLCDTLTTYTGNTPQTGDAYAVVANGTYGNSALHTQVGSPWQVGTKYGVTLASTDVTGNLPADLQTIKTQTVTCAAGVTIGPYVGNATHAITVDASGYVTFNNSGVATSANQTTIISDITALGSPQQAGSAVTLPSIPSNWITAAGIAASALNGKGDWALASVAPSWYTTSVTVAGYASGQDPWTNIKAATPGNSPTAGTVEWLFRLIDADLYTTDSGSPWTLSHMVRGSGAPGTGTLLVAKGVYDTGGNPITSTTVVVGGQH